MSRSVIHSKLSTSASDREVEEEVACKREEEVCKEMMKPVCTKNRLDCTKSGEDSVITFSEDATGTRSVEVTGFIGKLIRTIKYKVKDPCINITTPLLQEIFQSENILPKDSNLS